MKIKKRDFFLTRGGRVVQIDSFNKDTQTWYGHWIPPLWWDNQPRTYAWDVNGRYSPEVELPWDLVKSLTAEEKDYALEIFKSSLDVANRGPASRVFDS